MEMAASVVVANTGQPSVVAAETVPYASARAAEVTLAAAAVTRDRQSGASWTAIGAQLGLSRQGAQQRFTRASVHESTKMATRAY